MIREFKGYRKYCKGSYQTPEIHSWEFRRAIFDAAAKPLRAYLWGDYKLTGFRWIEADCCNANWTGEERGRCYGKTLPTLAARELRFTGLPEMICEQKHIDPEKHLAVRHEVPQLEQLVKAGLYGLVRECINHCGWFRSYFAKSAAGGLIRQLGIDAQQLKRLRENQGSFAFLKWLRFEKITGKMLPDQTIHWLCREGINEDTLKFITDRMSVVQAVNYIQRQMRETGMNSRYVLMIWGDYLSMAKRLKMDTNDAIIYRVRKLRQRHDELVEEIREREPELRAAEILEKNPHLEEIFEEIKEIYAYSDKEFQILVPARIEDILQEGNELHHQYRNEYYNQNAPSVTDEVYDRLFDELVTLEEETGICMADSPTQTVGYPAASKLEKTTHTIPLLSLEKTKSHVDMLSFIGERQIILMLKLDGLTLKLTCENGVLAEAATRGDGNEGEIVTHNVKGISGIPQTIPYKERLVVTGEALIRPSDFERLCDIMTEADGEPYRNGRNLAAGSVRLLNAADCATRKVTFLPFGVQEGFAGMERKSDRLYRLAELGFSPCKFFVTNRSLTPQDLENGTMQLRRYAREHDIPIDGIVATYNDIAYSASCGRTGHHYKDGLAYKFEDERYETILRSIEWTPSRSGVISPVAVFDTVQINGCDVSRASLHNLNFINSLRLQPDCRVLVSKRNQIIPHIEDNLDQESDFDIMTVFPRHCPCCGQATRVHVNRRNKTCTTLTVRCDNEQCETRNLRRFIHFVGKKAMDIEGLSEATLEKFIGRG